MTPPPFLKGAHRLAALYGGDWPSLHGSVLTEVRFVMWRQRLTITLRVPSPDGEPYGDALATFVCDDVRDGGRLPGSNREQKLVTFDFATEGDAVRAFGTSEAGEPFGWASGSVAIASVSSVGFRTGHNEVAASVPGAEPLVLHYGEFPSFHDAWPLAFAVQEMDGDVTARLRVRLNEPRWDSSGDMALTLVMGGVSVARFSVDEDFTGGGPEFYNLSVLGGPGAWELDFFLLRGEGWRFECETLSVEDIQPVAEPS